MPKKIFKNILWVTIPTLLFCFLIAEFLVFRFFIPACTPPLYCFDEQFKLVHFQPQTSGLFTAGRGAQLRSRWRANNYGWNSEVDYVPAAGAGKPLVAVIGDSYVEALQVEVAERFPAVLQRLMGDDFLVYSFGISGAPLSHYLHMSRYVNQVFKPQTLIILVVHNDFYESLASLHRKPMFHQISWQNGSFTEIPPVPFENSPLLRICRGSAVFRYLEMNCGISALLKNISVKLNRSKKEPTYNANIDVNAVAQERELIRWGVGYLVSCIRRENPEKKIIFMMDAPRFDIYAHTLEKSNVWWLHEILEDACRTNGMEFLDLTVPFAQHFEKFHQYLETGVDAHWNRLGHHLAARALWDRLKGTGALSR